MKFEDETRISCMQLRNLCLAQVQAWKLTAYSLHLEEVWTVSNDIRGLFKKAVSTPETGNP